MKVIAHGCEYECASAKKTESSVFLYDEQGNNFAAFRGIKDMSAWTVEDGAWMAPEPTTEERIAALEDALCEMDAANAASIAELEDALCEIDAGGM